MNDGSRLPNMSSFGVGVVWVVEQWTYDEQELRYFLVFDNWPRAYAFVLEMRRYYGGVWKIVGELR